MSKFIPDPQIQSLRAMRAGDISFALPSPLVMTVGAQHTAIAQPIVLQSIVFPPAVPAVVAVVATPSESPIISSAFQTILSEDTLQSKSLIAVESVEALSGTPSESPVVGVAFATSVV